MELYVPNDRPKKRWIKPLRYNARQRLCASVHQSNGRLTVENNIHCLRSAMGFADRCCSCDPNAACAQALLRTALIAPLRTGGHERLTKSVQTFANNPRQTLPIVLH
ncbi:MAG: hypothetical protein KA004_17595 [Verrucomicrobiales bacterium]|nr:hypothetical protein [Verrucomicrobiales bacterium]